MRFGLELYDVINYNEVISTTDSLQFVKDVRFTDVQIVENVIVKYVKAGNFWDDPRTVSGETLNPTHSLPVADNAIPIVSRFCTVLLVMC